MPFEKVKEIMSQIIAGVDFLKNEMVKSSSENKI
jgi:hypothetical protein